MADNLITSLVEVRMMMRAAILSTVLLVGTSAFGQAAGAPVVAGAVQRILEDGAAGAAATGLSGVGGQPLVLGIRDRSRLLGLGRHEAAVSARGPALGIGTWRGDDQRAAAAWSGAGEPRLALPVAPSISLDFGYRFVTNEDLAADAFLAAERGSLDPDHVSHSVTIYARWQF
jgi:hypothetical protein